MLAYLTSSYYGNFSIPMIIVVICLSSFLSYITFYLRWRNQNCLKHLRSKPNVDLYSGTIMFPQNCKDSLLSSYKNIEIKHQDLEFSIYKCI